MENQIELLKGPDRVRKRPNVIFGSTDIEGVKTAVEMLLNILTAECAAGHSDRLTVALSSDGTIRMQDNGRGIYFGEDDTIWKEVFCQMYPGPKYSRLMERNIFDDSKVAGDNLELYGVLCASEYMDVRVNREGIHYALHFEKGENIGGLTKTPTTQSAGTEFRFKPDPEIFPDIDFCDALAPWFCEKARTLALQIPGAKIIFCREDSRQEYFYPSGIADYLREENGDRMSTPFYLAQLEGQWQERYNRPIYTAGIRVGLCFSDAPGFIRCFHNLKELPYGGLHRNALLDEVIKFLEYTLECQIETERLLSRLQLVIVTTSELTDWENGARTSIKNILIRDLAKDTIGENFRHFAKENKSLLRKLLCQ